MQHSEHAPTEQGRRHSETLLSGRLLRESVFFPLPPLKVCSKTMRTLVDRLRVEKYCYPFSRLWTTASDFSRLRSESRKGGGEWKTQERRNHRRKPFPKNGFGDTLLPVGA